MITSTKATKGQTEEEPPGAIAMRNEAKEEPPGVASMESEEEEPPSTTATRNEAKEEPPHKRAVTNKDQFFGHVPEESWNDWRWHFRNRITTVEQLASFIPLSAKDKARLKLVTTKYPLSVTPYYLSLINPCD